MYMFIEVQFPTVPFENPSKCFQNVLGVPRVDRGHASGKK